MFCICHSEVSGRHPGRAVRCRVGSRAWNSEKKDGANGQTCRRWKQVVALGKLGPRKKPQGNEIIVEKNLTKKISKIEAEEQLRRVK